MSEIIPFKRPIKPHDLVLRFLNSLGHKRDAEFYLSLFTSVKPESFALIVLDEDVLRDDMDAVLFEIRYLMRLSLYPVVLLRSSNDMLEKLEIENYFKKARISLNLLSDNYSDDEKLEFIKQRIRDNTLPLLHLDPDLSMAVEITKLASILRTGKIIFLKKSGGIVDHANKSMFSIINLRFELENLQNSDRLEDADKEFLSLCAHVIERCGHRIVISVVSPNNLMRELFTVKGAGSLVQLGSKIKRFEDWEGIDPRSLRRLLEMSFEKSIRDEFFKEKFDRIYIEENYMGAAVIKNCRDMHYLSKFAVGTEARGLGIGRDLWQEILRNHRGIFWRSNPDKFISHWYTKQCDGMHRDKNWTVFWKGIDRHKINDAIDFALEQPIDFE